MLREREGDSRRTPVVAMTANALAGDRERCLAAGMDGYLTKPVRPDELTAAVSQWLPKVETDPGTAAMADESTDEPLAATVEPVSLQLLDRGQLAELRSLGGSAAAGFMEELVNVFLVEGATEVGQIRGAIEARDANAMLNGAHRLKGSAMNLGCGALADAAEAIEVLGRSGTVEGADALVDRLATAFDQTATALKIELDAA
jgi:HPt (histidine-containing phosphotransfer) domain-containing protein